MKIKYEDSRDMRLTLRLRHGVHERILVFVRLEIEILGVGKTLYSDETT